jgi:hypothetical protein
MLLETCQLLYTCHWIVDGVTELPTAPLLKDGIQRGYKKSHWNHPCAKWLRMSLSSYIWLATLGQELLREYNYRYPGRHHACGAHIEWLYMNRPQKLVERGWVPLDRSGVARPEGLVTVQGYMRPSERPGLLSAADSPASRRFHNFDIPAMGAALGLTVAPFGLAVVVPGRARPDGGLGSTPAPNQGGVPNPATGFPAPSNPHLGYAITWFGLAVAWTGIFALWASRRISTP